MIKRLCSAFLAVLIIFSIAIPARADDIADNGAEPFSTKFDDVEANAYYANAVTWASDNGITSGVSATKFAPNNTCTRAQIVTFLWRAFGENPSYIEGAGNFTDVKSSEYYFQAVRWAASHNITNGTSATKFSPNEPCTRAQIVTFIWRSIGSPSAKKTTKFSDVKSSDYFGSAVSWAVENEVTNGTSSTSFSPNATCTRAQAVTFIYRASEQIEMYDKGLYIYGFLTHQIGLNKAQACGVLGNMWLESRCEPTQLEKGYTWDSGAGYGLVQWTNVTPNGRTTDVGTLLSKGDTFIWQDGLRRTNLVNWCTCNGFSYKSGGSQLLFMQYELENQYQNMFAKLKKCPNTRAGSIQAAEIWLEFYECIPRNSEYWQKNLELRSGYAGMFWDFIK